MPAPFGLLSIVAITAGVGSAPPRAVHAAGGDRGTAMLPGASLARFASLALMSLLSSCANFSPLPIDPAVLAQSFEARTLADVDLQRYLASHGAARAPVQDWDFYTLTLAAYYFSPDLDIARARTVTREAAVRTAAQRPNPSLQLPFGYTSNPTPGETAYTFGLGLDIPIETAGKRGYRIEQARQLTVAARFDVGNAAWQVRSRLRTQLLALYVARRRSAIFERQVQAQQSIVQMIETRLEVGAASAPEVSQARITLDRDRLDRDHAGRQISDAKAAAAAVIGVPPTALDGIEIRLDTFADIHPELPDAAVQEQALLNRSDVQAALAEYAASQSALQLEIANQYPDLHIGPGYTYDLGAHKYVFSLAGITLPLFHRNEGPIAQARAHRAEAATRVRALQATAIGDAQRAAQSYRSALASLHLSESLLSKQAQRLTALRQAFQAGAADRLSVALAEHEAGAAALAHQDALAQVQRSIGQLEDAMQRPLTGTGMNG